MRPNPFEPVQTSASDSFSLEVPAGLVFDDDPLEPMLSGAAPTAPSPACVLDIWQQGLDRSEACARALAAVLVQSQEAISQISDLDGAERCLRASIESEPQREGVQLAACLSGLGRVLELEQRADEAESLYRRALDIQEKTLGSSHEVTFNTGMRLAQLLELSNRKDEATRLRIQLEARRLMDKEDGSNLNRLRSAALDMYVAKHYAEAEGVYRRLVEKRFELGSTHCHLARLFLTTGRDEDARHEVDRAWAVRHESPAYVLVRVHFFKTVLQMLAGGDWKAPLRELQCALAQPGACEVWTLQPLLERLRTRMRQDDGVSQDWELVNAIGTAINDHSKLAELESNPLWKAVCGTGEPVPAETTTTATADPSQPVS